MGSNPPPAGSSPVSKPAGGMLGSYRKLGRGRSDRGRFIRIVVQQRIAKGLCEVFFRGRAGFYKWRRVLGAGREDLLIAVAAALQIVLDPLRAVWTPAHGS